MRNVILVAVVAAAWTGAAIAQATSSPPPGTQPPKKERRICRSQAVTGSLVEKRTCKTRTEWDAELRESREAVETLQRPVTYSCGATEPGVC